MSVPLYVDTRIYLASILGTWTPKGPVDLNAAAFPAAQAAANDATCNALGLTDRTMSFHILTQAGSGEPVHRTRWRLESQVSGPALRPSSTGPYPTEVSLYFRVYPHSDVVQTVSDPTTESMPYRGVLGEVVPAFLLRHRWGPRARTLTLDGFGSGSFQPNELRYSSLWGDRVMTMPYDDSSADYASYMLVGSARPDAPGLWLATDDDLSATWQLSYCVEQSTDSVSQRWDSPRQAPGFEPVPWTAV